MNTPSHNSPPPVSSRHYSRRFKHQRACKISDVAAAVLKLKTDWSTLDTLARATAIAHLEKAGCTLRGLAHDLGCSEASMRWYMDVAELSDAEKQSIASGEGAKRALALAKQEKTVVARARRMQNQRIRDAFTARLSKIAIRWIEEQQLSGAYLELFVEEADRRLWHSRDTRVLAPSDSRAALESELANCEPKHVRPFYTPDLVEYFLEWFVAWIFAVVPEMDLRERVLQTLKAYTRVRLSHLAYT